MSKTPNQVHEDSSKIFMSYRRDDSAGHAGRLYDSLRAHYGADRIFMDIDTIELGENFVVAIKQAVTSCQVLIAVIGKQWLSSHDETGRRIDNPNDFVRIEIAAALERGVRVIPVLVQGVAMPSAQDLPVALQPLALRHAIELSDVRWAHDAQRLLNTLDQDLSRTAQGNSQKPLTLPSRSKLKSPAFILIALVLVALILGVVYYSINKQVIDNHNIPAAVERRTMRDPKASAQGINVSSAQIIDWAKLNKDFIGFFLVRATVATDSKDPSFDDKWKSAQKNGFTRGAYHVFHSNKDAGKQANHYLQTVRLETGDLPPILDIKDDPSVGPTDRRNLATPIRKWLEVVERATGRKPIIFTTKEFWDAHMTGEFGAYPLWLESDATPETLPKGWKAWTFWQYSSGDSIEGVMGGAVKTSMFNGSYESLMAFAKGQQQSNAPLPQNIK